MSTKPENDRWVGIDFSGDSNMWNAGRRTSNIWIAQICRSRRGENRFCLIDLRRVQEFSGAEHPFQRLALFLAKCDFTAAAIDAPFSLPADYLPREGHRALLAEVGKFEDEGRAFPDGRVFVVWSGTNLQRRSAKSCLCIAAIVTLMSPVAFANKKQNRAKSKDPQASGSSTPLPDSDSPMCDMSSQTQPSYCLVRNRRSVEKLPPPIQLRNDEAVKIHISNMSPLDNCMLASTAFAPTPPSNGATRAVTAISALTPLGLGGIPMLTAAAQTNAVKPALDKADRFLVSLFSAQMTSESNKNPGKGQSKAEKAAKEQQAKAQAALDAAKRHIQDADTDLDKLIGGLDPSTHKPMPGNNELLMMEMQLARQQDGTALAAMYAALVLTDFRSPSPMDFANTYAGLQTSLAAYLGSAPPGENPRAFSDYSVIHQDAPLYNPPAPSGSSPYAAAGTIAGLQQLLARIKSTIAQARADVASNPDASEFLSAAFIVLDGRFSVADNALTQIVANDTALRTQQTSVAQLEINLQQLQATASTVKDNMRSWITSLDLAVPASKNGTVSGTVTCVNRLDSTKTTLDPMPYSVAYQVVPRFSVSAGMLFSSVQSRAISATQEKTGVDATNTDTVQSVVTLTKGADVQAIPFTFLDLRIGKSWSYRNADQDKMSNHKFLSKHVFTAGVSGGLGVNPYSGGPNAEFFAGLFGAIDRFTLHAGADWGRLTNVGSGFLVGDVVPSGTMIPTTSHYVVKFGVGLSVRLYP